MLGGWRTVASRKVATEVDSRREALNHGTHETHGRNTKAEVEAVAKDGEESLLRERFTFVVAL
jgi:hypothetical protein